MKPTAGPLTPSKVPTKPSIPKNPSIYEEIYHKACDAITANPKELNTCNQGYTPWIIPVFSLMSQETNIGGLKIWTDTAHRTARTRRTKLNLAVVNPHPLKNDKNLNGKIPSLNKFQPPNPKS
jgi:hypothetical protein